MKKIKIVCTGDSHTAGYPGYDPLFGGNETSSYQFWLGNELKRRFSDMDVELINCGICGDGSRGIAGRLISSLKSSKPDLVILQGGTNDLNMLTDEAIFENLKKGYEAALRDGIAVVAVSIPPVSLAGYANSVLSLNRRIERYCLDTDGIFFADWFSALKDGENNILSEYDCGDGVHLSVEGYRRAGMVLAETVVEVLSC